MQLVMVDQFVLDFVSQESHPGRLATVWITSLDFMLDSVKKRGKTLNNWTRVSLNRALGCLWMCHSIYKISRGMKVDWWLCRYSQGVARFGGFEVKQVEI
jgi:hypothetical protein